MNASALPATASATLVPVGSPRRLGGFGNLLRRELGAWWRTRSWWIQLLVWLVILDGISLIVMMDASMSSHALTAEAVRTFLQVSASAIAIGVVVTVQGAIVGEKELGTAAWVVSKPVSRASFVMAKFVGHGCAFLGLAVIVPTTVFAIEARALLTTPVATGDLALAAGVVALSVVFYLAFTLALGTLFQSRGPVAGIGLATVLAGLFFKGMLPSALVYASPWLLGDVAASIALGTELDPNWPVPIGAAAILSIGLLWVAVRRFEREEF